MQLSSFEIILTVFLAVMAVCAIVLVADTKKYRSEYLHILSENGQVKAAPVCAVPVSTAPAAAAAEISGGELMLVGTDEKTAAMLMAIVADELKAPLNSLKFIAIRDITE